ncbi:MAG: helix-turn-helix transcriptional regulator [Coriobacteriales bacterium]|nr:helix-turn-helix transcriptional regulator [Coriobacteriales bacterium]
MNVEIAERLASRRREAGYSQEALAEKLGVTRQAVSKWERSESSPDTDNLIALARLYGVSLDELLNVNPAIEDDVAFEAADRATKRPADEANASPSATSPGFGDAEFAAGAGGGDYVKVNWREGVHVKDAKTGEEVHVSWDGVKVRTADYAKGLSGAGLEGQKSRCRKAKNCSSSGSSVNIEIDGQPTGYMKAIGWSSFPLFLLVLIAYILWGFFGIDPLQAGAGALSPWAYGLFVFALVPVYHMVIHAIRSRSFIRFVQGFYPFASAIFFLWMWLIEALPHPTWVIFLTIPILEWICEGIYRRRRV